MIKGRGFLANALQSVDSDDIFFYVNGISNSVIQNVPDDNFEANEIKEASISNGERLFIYVSSCQVNAEKNLSRPYVNHKFKMENLVKDLFKNYLIVRTSNLVGNNPWNTNTLFNFLNNALQSQAKIMVDDKAIRNVLDVDHFVVLFDNYLKQYPNRNTIIDIVNPVSHNMSEIINIFEKVCSKTFNKTPVEQPVAHFEASANLSVELASHAGLSFDGYLPALIKKYYC